MSEHENAPAVETAAEQHPDYPFNPEVYANEPDTNPMKRWFARRGAIFEGGKYLGGFSGHIDGIQR